MRCTICIDDQNLCSRCKSEIRDLLFERITYEANQFNCHGDAWEYAVSIAVSRHGILPNWDIPKHSVMAIGGDIVIGV
jgi:hypothetical protein